jgi:hypothetical protein
MALSSLGAAAPKLLKENAFYDAINYLLYPDWQSLKEL